MGEITEQPTSMSIVIARLNKAVKRIGARWGLLAEKDLETLISENRRLRAALIDIILNHDAPGIVDKIARSALGKEWESKSGQRSSS